MTEMLERVARAIEEASDKYEPDAAVMARAAIKAMRKRDREDGEGWQ